MPTIAVVENYTFDTTDVDHWVTNDPNKFYVYFLQIRLETGEYEFVEACNCAELIGNMTDLHEGERQSFLDEIAFPEF